MGGNALKNTKTRRLNKQDFSDTQSIVIEKLQSFFPSARIESIPAYFDKKTFGDLDILISADVVKSFKDKEKEKKWMAEVNPLGVLMSKLFNSEEAIENDTVLSFDYREHKEVEYGFQIDLIYTDNDYFDFAKNYFSYNDLGNLIGRVAAGMGLKFGHNGLTYNVKEKDDHFAIVEISRDFYKSLDFLGFSVERYKQGFNNLEEIFEYVSSSKYYNPDLYKLENRSYAERVRDRKRPTYRAFLKYSSDLEQSTDHNFFIFPEDRKLWLPAIFETFEGSKSAYDKAWNFRETRKNAKKIFNGKNVGELTNLEHKYLGHFMNHIRSKFDTNEDLFFWVVSHNKHEFDNFILTSLIEFDRFKHEILIEDPIKNLLKAKQIKIK